MRGRIMFAAGLAAGYVLGSRAGRGAYNDIKSRFQSAVNSPQVQSGLEKAKDVAEQRAPKLTNAVASVAAAGTAKAADAAEKSASVPSTTSDTLNEAASNLADTASETNESTAPTATD